MTDEGDALTSDSTRPTDGGNAEGGPRDDPCKRRAMRNAKTLENDLRAGSGRDVLHVA